MQALPDSAGTYAQLAACCAGACRVVELGCGARRAVTGPRALAIDLAPGGDVRARGEALPLADRSVDRAIAHLSLDVIADCDPVMRELARVLTPSGEVAAIVGGGPVASPDDGDAFAALADHLARHAIAPAPRGDRRVRDERAWRAWWPRHTVTATRLEARITGPALLPTLSALARIPLAAARAAIAGRDHARVVTWLVRVRP